MSQTMMGISRLDQSISRWLHVWGAAIRHLPSILRNRWMALTARVKWIGVKQTDWRHAWLVTAGCWSCPYSRCSNMPWLYLKLLSAGPPTLRRPPTIRNWSWSRTTLWRTTHETTHRHSCTSPLTAASLCPSSRRRGRRGGRSQPAASFQVLPPTMWAGGRAIVLRARVVTISVKCAVDVCGGAC